MNECSFINHSSYRVAGRFTRLKLVACLVFLATFVLVTSSCGVRYYSATVNGYVKDSSFVSQSDAGGGNSQGGQNNGGINDAEIRVYLQDPTGNPEAFVVKTSSMTSGGNAGFWSHKITWSTSSPAFSDTGDSGTVWVTVKRMGYFPRTVKVTGILSEATNLVNTIELIKIKTTEVRGLVVNEQGKPVNGVNVVLDLESTKANDTDIQVATATVDGKDGVFLFTDVPWNDPDSIPTVSRTISADGSTATENIRLYISDTAFYSDANNHAILTTITPIAITSGVKVNLSTTPLVVRSAQFTVPSVTGRVIDVNDSTKGLNGVQVSIHIPAANANQDPVVRTATLSSDGWFRFDTLTWTNTRPVHSATGLYDDVTPAQIYINDANYYSANDRDNPLSITLTSGVKFDQTNLATVASIPAGKATFKASAIRGRIVLSGGTTGINGVQVNLNLADNTGNPAYSTVTGNMDFGSGAKDGCFEFKNVNWTTVKPVWQDAGKTICDENIQIFVNDAAYTSPNGSASPFMATISSDPLSGAATPVDLSATPLTVKMASFNVPKITGKVVSSTDGTTGLGNIQVSLALKSVTANNNNPATATTDKNGVFTFTNIKWTNTTPTAPNSDTITAAIEVNDQNYKTMVPLAVSTLKSDQALDVQSVPIQVSRTASWTFNSTISGNCMFRWKGGANNATTTQNISGVKVTITALIPPESKVQAPWSPKVLTTDANGAFTYNLAWTRDPDYVPAADSQANGGDTLSVSVTYGSNATEGNVYSFTSQNPFTVMSWINNNIVPDAVDSDPSN